MSASSCTKSNKMCKYTFFATCFNQLCPTHYKRQSMILLCSWLSLQTFFLWSSLCFVIRLRIMRTCKHTTWCFNTRTLGGRVMAGRGMLGYYEREHLPRLVHCSACSPLHKVRAASHSALQFPMGKQTDWRQTASSTLQTQTPLCEQASNRGHSLDTALCMNSS